jgi:hypothetical protein
VTAAAGSTPADLGAGRWPLAVAGQAGALDPLAWRDWMVDAACAGVGAGEFYGPDARGEWWCRRCPVSEVCFWWAVVVEFDAGYHFGVWGGAAPAVREQVGQVAGMAWARARLVDALCEWAPHRSAGEPGRGRERRAG